MNNTISRADKLKVIGLNESLTIEQINDDVLDNLYNKTIDPDKQKNNTHIKKSKHIKINKNNEKYILTLNFLNALLTSLNKEKIDDIIKFKDIRKDELLKPECKQILENYLDKITAQFGKVKLNYRHRHNFKNYIITIIKHIVTVCGYTFKPLNKQVNTLIGNNLYKHSRITIYSVLD